MKRALLLSAALLCIVAAFVAGIAFKLRRSDPAVLLDRLQHAPAREREELIMRLGLAHGDVDGALVAAFEDRSAPAAFRADVLELVFRRWHRSQSHALETSLQAALTDPDAAVRRAAAEGFATYGTTAHHAAMLDLLEDRDPAVRRIVMAVYVGDGFWKRPRSSLWDALDEAQTARVVALGRRGMEQESDPELRFLARALVGRRIAILCDEAGRAMLKSDPAAAEQLLREALALDPGGRRARIKLVRFLLGVGRREEALRLGREFGAVLEIPRLQAAPEIDGDPEEEAWKGALEGNEFFANGSAWAGVPARGRSRFLAGHRDGTLYIAVYGYEPDLSKLAVKHMNRDSSVWRDDCVELFFDPGNTEKDVYQFVINAAGALFDSYRMNERENTACRYAGAVHAGRGYWCCEFAVAASDLEGGRIDADAVWGINIMRTRIGGGAEQCAAWPTYGGSQRFDLFPLAVFAD